MITLIRALLARHSCAERRQRCGGMSDLHYCGDSRLSLIPLDRLAS